MMGGVESPSWGPCPLLKAGEQKFSRSLEVSVRKWVLSLLVPQLVQNEAFGVHFVSHLP